MGQHFTRLWVTAALVAHSVNPGGVCRSVFRSPLEYRAQRGLTPHKPNRETLNGVGAVKGVGPAKTV